MGRQKISLEQRRKALTNRARGALQLQNQAPPTHRQAPPAPKLHWPATAPQLTTGFTCRSEITAGESGLASTEFSTRHGGVSAAAVAAAATERGACAGDSGQVSGLLRRCSRQAQAGDRIASCAGGTVDRPSTGKGALLELHVAARESACGIVRAGQRESIRGGHRACRCCRSGRGSDGRGRRCCDCRLR